MTSKTHQFKNAISVHALKLICSTGVSNFQTSKLVFCMYNKLRLHAAIGHFRVPLCLCFKASLSAKPFLWKWLLFSRKRNCVQNSFSYERFCTYTRFETEAQENSEMAYFKLVSPWRHPILDPTLWSPIGQFWTWTMADREIRNLHSKKQSG